MKIGLTGYNSATGLGSLNNTLARFFSSQGVLAAWGIYRHPTKHLTQTSVEFCPKFDLDRGGSVVDEFLSKIDTLIFCEHPLNGEILKQAKGLGKKIICIPMQEWLSAPTRGMYCWETKVDKWIFPNKFGHDRWKSEYPNSVYFSWPTEPDLFEFKKRSICESFLFVNGNGGHRKRKGITTILDMLSSWPEAPVTIYSQVNVESIKEQTQKYPFVVVKSAAPSKEELYSKHNGDVLLYPHTTDGLGLEAFEALCCGMPIISTAGEIWDEFPSIGRIKSQRVQLQPIMHENRVIVCERFIPDADHLAELCRDVFMHDIEAESFKARSWAEEKSWDNLGATFLNLVKDV